MSQRGSKNIYLVGFSGSGKSTIGSMLARRLGLPFYDTDIVIENEAGCSIADVFKEFGETVFRSLESKIIRRFINRNSPSSVVALGGGAFQSKANRDDLLGSGLVVYLGCSTREIYRRLRGKHDRPLMNALPQKGETPREARIRKIHLLLAKRLTNYRRAHIHCSTSRKKVNVVVNELILRIRSYHA
jgi:shikimate kinase